MSTKIITPNTKGSCSQPLHKKIIDKIHDLVGDGIINPRMIKFQLQDFVKSHPCLSNENIPIDKNNTSYFPDLSTIANHVRLALRAYRYNKLDQASLQEKIREWKAESSNHNIFFRPQTCSDENEDDGNSFLFVHQSKWQQHLLMRYGQEIVFLDATYRTMKYSLPLFLLAVQTNVGYLPVAELLFILKRVNVF